MFISWGWDYYISDINMPFIDKNKQLRYERERYKKRKLDRICPDCGKPSNKTVFCSKCNQKRNLSSLRFRDKNRKEYNRRAKIYIKKYRERDKQLVFIHYGGNPPKCSCCGKSCVEFLTIDHVNNDGAKDRKKGLKGHDFYRWLIKNDFPEGYQVLCYNCNCGRAKNGGICPHNYLPSHEPDQNQSQNLFLQELLQPFSLTCF